MLFTPFFILVLPLISGKVIHPVEAIFLSLIIEVFGFGSATWGYLRQKVIDFPIMGFVLAVSVPVSVLISLFAHRVPEGILLFVLGLTLLTLAALMFSAHLKTEIQVDPSSSPYVRRLSDSQGRSYVYAFRRTPLGVFISALGGLFVGLVGIGVGEFKTTYFVVGQKMPPRVAVATAVPIVMGTVTAAVVTRLYVTGTGIADFQVPWNIAAMCVPAVLLGGQIAPLINRHLNPGTIRVVLFLLFTLVGATLILRGFL